VPKWGKIDSFFTPAKNIYQTRRGVRGKNIFFEKNFALYLQGLTNNFFKKILKISIKRAGSPNYGGASFFASNQKRK
jgi:hypothetical protein